MDVNVFCKECQTVVPREEATPVWETKGRSEECTYRCQACEGKFADPTPHKG